MALMAIMIGVGSVLGFVSMVTPVTRGAQHGMNRLWPNEVLDPSSSIAVRRRQLSEAFDYSDELKAQGFDEGRRELIYKLSQQLLGLSELITLYRRGQIKDIEDVYVEADKVGWSKPDVNYMLKVTEIIPSAGDIIRYAVREVYSPEISKAFGQFDELGVSPGEIDGVLSGDITDPALDPTGVLAKARSDIEAAGLPPATFTKEWAAHWLLPSVMQGFEMLHRGVIPFKAAGGQDLSLERLMVALDIMPAWRKPLTDISYHPFTRVDVRRMHKTGVLDDEAVFTAYADVGFSPLAPDHEHDTVADSFTCEVCRHESKCGQMLDFTIAYNYRPPEVEATAEDNTRAKERDLTKTDILNGLRDGLLSAGEATTALGYLGYDAEEVDYYLAKIEYQRDQDELSDTTHYLHDAYIKGVLTFNDVLDELGKLNLPAKMTDYYLKVWDLERIARTNKPTKSELMSFRRKGVIDEETWRTEMVGLGYPNRYINWYATTG